MKKTEKITIPCEISYIFAILILSFSVAMISATDFGLSMIVSPAYILSCKIDGLTFGQSEYIIQGVMFILFCILMKKVKLIYFASFATGLIYGAVLDLWRLVIPHFNPEVTAPGSLPFGLRIIYFIIGIVLTALAIALFFRTYIYPQVYDFFVKGVSEKYNLDRGRFKIGFDIFMFAVSVAMTLIIFRKFVGIGIGTVIMTFTNGIMISFFGKVIDKFFIFQPKLKKFSKLFDL